MSPGQDTQDTIRELEERVQAQQKELDRLRQVEIRLGYFKGQLERVKRDRAELEKLYDDHITQCAGIVVRDDLTSYTPQHFRNGSPSHPHASTRCSETNNAPTTGSAVQSSINQLRMHPTVSPAVSHSNAPSNAGSTSVERQTATGGCAPTLSKMNASDKQNSVQTLESGNSTASSSRIKRETLTRIAPEPEPKLEDTSTALSTMVIDLTKAEVMDLPLATQSNSSTLDVAKPNKRTSLTASSDGTDTVRNSTGTTPPPKKANLNPIPTPPPLPPVLPTKTGPPTSITNAIPDANARVNDRVSAGAITAVNTAPSTDVPAPSSAVMSSELARKRHSSLETAAKSAQHNILNGVVEPGTTLHVVPDMGTSTTTTTTPGCVSLYSGVNPNPSPTMMASTASPQLHAPTGLVENPTHTYLQKTRSTILSILDKTGELEKEQNMKVAPEPSMLRDQLGRDGFGRRIPLNMSCPPKKKHRKVESAEITSDNSNNLKKLIQPEKDTLAGPANKIAPPRPVLQPTIRMLTSRDQKTVGEDLRNARVAKIGQQKIAVDESHLTSRAFSRAFISQIFGGSPQETFSRPRQDLIDQHGYDGFMCLNTSYNPNAPRKRGTAGLFFSLGAPRETPRKHEKVFLRTGANLWMYLGDYEMVRTDPLSAIEYQSLNPNVTTTWTSKAMDKGWALHIRASIRLRRNLGREPTPEELKIFVEKAGQNSNLAAVKLQEIEDAFTTGREKICVWTMRCLKYDHAFQRKLAEGFDALPPVAQEKFSATQSNKNIGKRKQTAPKKRPSESSDEDMDDLSGNLSGSDSDVVLLDSDDGEYKPRGTRSRPNKRLKT